MTQIHQVLNLKPELAAAHTRAKERIQRLNERRAAEETRRKAEDEANRTRYLDQLGRREPEIWEQVAVHILKRQPNEYAKAIGLLTDLHDLSVRRGKRAIFQRQLEKIRQTHAAKESFLRRLDKANL